MIKNNYFNFSLIPLCRSLHGGFKLILTILFIVASMLYFSILYGETLAEPPSNYHDIGAGTETNQYLINNLANLRWLSEFPDDWWIDLQTQIHFRQTSHIEALETASWNDGKGFRPIGYPIFLGGIVSHTFTGVYDGGNYLINNLFINQENDFLNVGLFDYVTNSTLLNVHLENIDVTFINHDKITHAGGLVGEANNSTIENISISGNINHHTRTNHFTGGIAGGIDDSIIKNCHSRVIINGSSSSFSSFAGGVVSHAYKTTILHSSFTGEITINGNAGASAGGIVGVTDTVNIESSFSTGNISGNTNLTRIYNVTKAGGIVGSLDYDSIIFNSYTSGEIIALGGYVSFAGGIAGSVGDGRMIENISASIIDRCYSIAMSYGMVSGGIAGILEWSYIFNSFWDIDKTGIFEAAGHNLVSFIINTHGKTTSEMKEINTYIINDWDFNFTWTINHSDNFGYPSLNMTPSPFQRIPYFSVSELNEGINLRWYIPENMLPSSFSIYRNGEVLAENITETSYLDTTIKNNSYANYLLFVHYSEPNGLSAPSNVRIILTTFPPRNLTSILDGDNVVLNWEEPLGGGNVVYVVFRDGKLITSNLGITFTSFTDINTVPGQTYTYGVSAAYFVPPILWYTDPILIDVTIPGGEEDLITKLIGNDPNPFRHETIISFALKSDTHVNIDIYNVRGQKIKSFVDDFKLSGEYHLIWDGTDNNGRSASSGVYFYKMTANSYTETKKMLRVK